MRRFMHTAQFYITRRSRAVHECTRVWKLSAPGCNDVNVMWSPADASKVSCVEVSSVD